MTENDCEDQGFSRISDGCTQCRSSGRRIALGRRQTIGGRWGWQCPQCKGWYGDAPAPKETGLLFQAPMVRALLREVDPKTQTRRIVKPQPVSDPAWTGGAYWQRRAPTITKPVGEAWSIRDMAQVCQYGQPGDRVWVREAWAPDPPIDDSWASTEWSGCGRRIDGVPERFQHPRFCNYAADWLHGPIRWRPGIHMPRWASRILLELTEVRVQRLQDISEADADSEGCERLDSDREDPDWNLCQQCGGTRLYTSFGPSLGACPDTDCTECDTYVKRYRHLWESIHGLGSWDANPWVWALSFRRINE